MEPEPKNKIIKLNPVEPDQTLQGDTTLPLYRRHLTTPIAKDLPEYQIIRELGSGSSGIIYKAQHIKLGRKVAIKMLHPQYFKNEFMLEQFRNEARISPVLNMKTLPPCMILLKRMGDIIS